MELSEINRTSLEEMKAQVRKRIEESKSEGSEGSEGDPTGREPPGRSESPQATAGAAREGEKDASLRDSLGRPVTSKEIAFTRDSIERWKKEGREYVIETPKGTRIHLVPEYTKKDREEVTMEDVMLLDMAIRIFGATLVGRTRKPKKARKG